jgi:elongation factor Ts
MAITATQVKELREMTGLGMMACKKALTEAHGDMEKAVEDLRKQGQATAAKRAGKEAKEGRISVIVQENDALVYEVNSETDFVARNEDFLAFANALGALLIQKKPADMDAANALTAEAFDGVTVEAKLTDLIGKIGEKITFRRFTLLPIDHNSQRAYSYIHGNGKIGVVVVLSSDKAAALSQPAAQELGKDLAMQVAAANPLAVRPEELDADVIAKEKEIYLTQAQSSGKPEKVWDKIVEGKLAKYYKEVALIKQEFIKDTDMSVSDRIKQTEKELDASLDIVSFVRYELGS